eukprot:38783-Amphidinium_carterae.1
MYEYFYDENDITQAQALHEGDEIENLERRARSKEDPKAEHQYEWYMEENKKLEKNLREEHEQHHGAFDEGEEYEQALEDKDSETIKRIIFEYAAKVRERKLQWREYK